MERVKKYAAFEQYANIRAPCCGAQTLYLRVSYIN
jgi:hypothetical protein